MRPPHTYAGHGDRVRLLVARVAPKQALHGRAVLVALALDLSVAMRNRSAAWGGGGGVRWWTRGAVGVACRFVLTAAG